MYTFLAELNDSMIASKISAIRVLSSVKVRRIVDRRYSYDPDEVDQ
ncbi:hypothetical protein [Paenibacillus amylolyticus]|nr:hypothetical protein [Paenibacillus amylolyticus]